jgi:hypothetical protein
LHSQETFFRTCAFLKVSETFSRRTPEGTVCAAAAAAAAEALPRPARAEALDDFEEEELEGESSPSSSASAAASSEAAAATGAGGGGGGAAAALPCVFLMTIFWMRFFFGERGLKRRSMSWPSRQSPGFFFFSLSLRFYPLVLSFSLTSMAESAASAALCAADFLGLADAATEREAGGGEPTERRRKCDAADGGGSGARCCCCGAAAAATALRGAPNELLLAMPPRVATTTGCCIFKKRRANRTKGSCRRSGTPPKKNLDESKCKPTTE